MRELKFRAWDKEELEMISPDKLLTLYNNGFLNEILVSAKKVTLMQYTGLKDKNGVEIYEGDILKVRSLHYEKDIGLDVVCFEKGCFCLRYEYWSDGLHKWRSIENYDSSDLDVVGNVHQNPDLLRKNND